MCVMKWFLRCIVAILLFGFGFYTGFNKCKSAKLLSYSDFVNLSLYCQADAGASNWALAVNQYKLKNSGNLPLNLAEVITEIMPINPKTEKNLILDPWGNQYRFDYDNKSGNYTVWSCGSDGASQSSLSRIGGDDVGVIVTQ